MIKYSPYWTQTQGGKSYAGLQVSYLVSHVSSSEQQLEPTDRVQFIQGRDTLGSFAIREIRYSRIYMVVASYTTILDSYPIRLYYSLV